MTKVSTGFGFSLTCHCSSCKWPSNDIDKLKAAGAKIEREMKVGSKTTFMLRCADLPCPRCAGTGYTLRFSCG
jgi:hypothetical protein